MHVIQKVVYITCLAMALHGAHAFCMDTAVIAQLCDIVLKRGAPYIEKYLDKNPTAIEALVALAQQDIHITTPLHEAARIHSRDDIISAILRRLPENIRAKIVNFTDPQGQTALHIAAMCGFTSNIETIMNPENWTTS
jgi:hypothetical protein